VRARSRWLEQHLVVVSVKRGDGVRQERRLGARLVDSRHFGSSAWRAKKRPV
jgi:hypothetical protein